MAIHILVSLKTAQADRYPADQATEDRMTANGTASVLMPLPTSAFSQDHKRVLRSETRSVKDSPSTRPVRLKIYQ